MAFEVIWGNAQKTILIQRYSELLTLEDYHQCIDASAALMQTVTHSVDLIMDLSNATVSNQAFLSAGNHAERAVPPNQRLVLMIGAPLHIQLIVKIAKSLFKKAAGNLYFVDTLTEAYRVIDKQPVP
jgi:hypothetical protein